jgi:mannuronan 5-epimerase
VSSAQPCPTPRFRTDDGCSVLNSTKLSALTIGLAAAVALAVPVVAAATADAAACADPVRYSAGSDTIYLTSAGAVDTLTEIKAVCPAAPLVEVAAGIWELNADLVLQNGATLLLDASDDVEELRLQSLPTGAQKDVSALTAQYGVIDMRGVKVTSWNGTGPDTDYAVPKGGVRGRAFVRALSYMDGSTPRESTMKIFNSDLGYLGYYGPEAYGVAFKARGCGIDTQGVCAALNVGGFEMSSRFHDNFMGTYTWGAQDMLFDHNVYEHNKSYGLDPHDDSDYLTITNNLFTQNNNHGLICSQRCDHLYIKGNRSIDNGHTPYVGPGDDNPKDNQVHGIMLHRGVTDSIIEDNEVSGQINGAGIAIFDSVGNTVKDNTIAGNKYGIRFSVGARDTVVTGNTIRNSGADAVLTYQGSDTPLYSGTSGRPAGVTFTDNTFSGSGAELFKIQDADRFTFTGGSATPSKSSRGPLFDRGQGHVYDSSVVTPKGTTFVLRGTSSVRTSLQLTGVAPKSVKVTKDAYSSVSY